MRHGNKKPLLNQSEVNQEYRNREMERKLKEQSMRRQGLHSNPQSVNQHKENLMRSLPPQLRPGNIGQLNNVLWPFWFTFSIPELVAGSSSQAFMTISQEAPFILVSMTKAAFTKTTGPTVYSYVDPKNYSAGKTDDLKFTMRDSQSSRIFHGLPMELDMIGDPSNPTVLPSPLYFLPSSTIELTYQNDNPTITYVPLMTFFGYRVRVDNANMLSTVMG